MGRKLLRYKPSLVGGFNPFEKICLSNSIISPGMGENKKYLSCHHLDHVMKIHGLGIPNTFIASWMAGTAKRVSTADGFLSRFFRCGSVTGIRPGQTCLVLSAQNEWLWLEQITDWDSYKYPRFWDNISKLIQILKFWDSWDPFDDEANIQSYKTARVWDLRQKRVKRVQT